MSQPHPDSLATAKGGFCLGLVSALLVLISGPGHNAGLWSFRTGFFLLRWGGYQGIFAGFFGLGVIAADRRRAVVKWALAAAVLGLLAGVLSFRP